MTQRDTSRTTTTRTAATPRRDRSAGGFSAQEQAAMKERAAELRASRGGKDKDLEPEVLARIAQMSEPDRSLASAVHEVIRASAPQLTPRTWYGFPAYAKDGKVLCFFQPAAKFQTRYPTLGFSDQAQLDDGVIWPTVYAVTRMGPHERATVAALVERAVGGAAAPVRTS